MVCDDASVVVESFGPVPVNDPISSELSQSVPPLLFEHNQVDCPPHCVIFLQSYPNGFKRMLGGRSSATLRILRGTKVLWSRFFPCNANRRSVKK